MVGFLPRVPVAVTPASWSSVEEDDDEDDEDVDVEEDDEDDPPHDARERPRAVTAISETRVLRRRDRRGVLCMAITLPSAPDECSRCDEVEDADRPWWLLVPALTAEYRGSGMVIGLCSASGVPL